MLRSNKLIIMKALKIFSIILTISILGISSSSAGTKVESKKEVSTSEIGIVSNSINDRVVVAFENQTDDPFTVAIEDSEGRTIHSETVSTAGIFSKRYDLAELADGEYTVKVADSNNQVQSSERIYKN